VDRVQPEVRSGIVGRKSFGVRILIIRMTGDWESMEELANPGWLQKAIKRACQMLSVINMWKIITESRKHYNHVNSSIFNIIAAVFCTIIIITIIVQNDVTVENMPTTLYGMKETNVCHKITLPNPVWWLDSKANHCTSVMSWSKILKQA